MSWGRFGTSAWNFAGALARTAAWSVTTTISGVAYLWEVASGVMRLSATSASGSSTLEITDASFYSEISNATYITKIDSATNSVEITSGELGEGAGFTDSLLRVHATTGVRAEFNDDASGTLASWAMNGSGHIYTGPVSFGSTLTATSLAVKDSGGDHTITIDTASDEAANRTLTIPALGGNKTLALIDLAQTFSAQQTFSENAKLTKSLSGTPYTVAISVDTDVLAIAGKARDIRISSSGFYVAIDGFDEGEDGEEHYIWNLPGGTDDKRISLNCSATTAGKQIVAAGKFSTAATVLYLEVGCVVRVRYDATLSVWSAALVQSASFPSGLHSYGNISIYGGDFIAYIVSWIRNISSDLVLIYNPFLAGGTAFSSYDVILTRIAAGVWTVGASYPAGTDGACIAYPHYTPAQITANQANYAITGRSQEIRASTDATREIQGIGAGQSGEVHYLVLTGSNNLTIKHDSSSATGKRIYCNGNADILLTPNDSVRLVYDSTTLVWRASSAPNRDIDQIVASDVTNATTTMAAITGLSANVLAAGKYTGKLTLFCDDSTAADGLKFDFDGGSATMTSFAAQGVISDTVSVRSLARTAALATDLVDATTTGSALVTIEFAFVVNAAGTFIPRFAQNAHTVGTGTITANSNMSLTRIP